ncbi:MAG: AMP-dependent synthetase/ligase [Bifidobacteriaceae bacterium]|nr:AMP-dependent synthetase/ligase [Bifidobacteriaceae bacterium]
MKQYSHPAVYETDPALNITDLMLARRDKNPAATMMEEQTEPGHWEPVSAGEVIERVQRIAKGLMALGVGHGDTVGIMGRTSIEWTLIDLALFYIGGAGVPIYETSSDEQAAWIVADSGMVAAVAELDRHADVIRAVPGWDKPLWLLQDGGLDQIMALGESVSDDALEARRVAVKGDDLAAIIYTSGTTGRPKGVELTHTNFVTSARNAVVELFHICGTGSRCLLFLPMAHVFARMINVIALSSPSVLGYAPSIATLTDDLQSFQPTYLLVVPRVLEKVYNSAEQKAGHGAKLKIFRWAAKVAIISSRELDSRGGLTPVRKVQYAIARQLVYKKLTKTMGGRLTQAVSGGAPLGERLAHFFRGIGLTVYEGYGLTETTAPTAVNPERPNKIGTVGRPLPGQSVAVADDGEILAKGPHIFRGYRGNPEATAQAIEDGWFHTGDVGTLDDDGFVTITGRRKEIIVTASGKNVAPAILEDRLRGHPLVSQVVVVGDGRPFIGALVTLDYEMLPGWLVAHGKSPLTPEQALIDPDIRASLERAVERTNKAVSRAESIREFRLIPGDFTEANGYLTPSLKVKRSLVLKDFAGEVDALYAEAAKRRSAESAR